MRKRLFASLLALVMTLSLLPISVFASENTDEETSSSTPTKTLGKTAEWADKDKGIAKITLTVQGEPSTTTTQPKSADIVFVIDQSSTMDEEDNDKLDAATDAAEELADELLPDADGKDDDDDDDKDDYYEGVRIAVIGFGKKAVNESNFHTNEDAVEDHLDDLEAIEEDDDNAGTNLQAGIHAAREKLKGSTADNKIIILLTDGVPNYSYQFVTEKKNDVYEITGVNYGNVIGDGKHYRVQEVVGCATYYGCNTIIKDTKYKRAYDGEKVFGPTKENSEKVTHGVGAAYEADLAKAEGMTIYAFGYDIAGDSDADKNARELLQKIASSDKYYYLATLERDSGDEEWDYDDDIIEDNFDYTALTGASVTTYTAYNAVVTDTMGDGFTVITGNSTYPITPSSGVTVSTDKKTLTWTAGELDDTVRTLTFYVQYDIDNPSEDAKLPTNKDAELTYTTDKEGKTDGTPISATSPELDNLSHTVTYVYDNGDSNTTERYWQGKTVTVEADPEKTGYDFTGWTVTGLADGTFDDNSADAGDTFIMPENDVTLKAGWTEHTYTVTYTDGVAEEEVFADQDKSAKFGESIPTFNGTPSRTGYTFNGWTWYKAEAMDTAITKPDTMPAYDLKAVAGWTQDHVPEPALRVTKRPYTINLEPCDYWNVTAKVGDRIEWLIVVENEGDAEGHFTLVDTVKEGENLTIYPELAVGETYYTIPANPNPGEPFAHAEMKFYVSYVVTEEDVGKTLANNVKIYKDSDTTANPIGEATSVGVHVEETNLDEIDGIQLGDFISKEYTAYYDNLDSRDTFHATATVTPLEDVDLLDGTVENGKDSVTVEGSVTLATDGKEKAFEFESLTLPVGAYMVEVSEDNDGVADVTYDESEYRFLLVVFEKPEDEDAPSILDLNEAEENEIPEYAAYGLEKNLKGEWVTVQEDSETTAIVFHNVYAPTEEDGIQLGNFISKEYTSRYGAESRDTFYANAKVWMLNNVELLDENSANEEDAQNSDPYTTVDGSVTLRTGEVKDFTFDTLSLPEGVYMVEVSERNDGERNITYDGSAYRFLLLVFGEDYEAYGLEVYDADEQEWVTETADDTPSSVTFCNEYTYRRPRPVPTVKPAEPKLNTDDHYAYLMGYPDGTVRPNGQITRAEAATIFFRLLTDESREQFWATSNSYSDVFPADWYNNAISTLSNAGIVSGYPDGTFRPNAPITRAEMSKMIALFADLDRSRDLFDDIAGHWAESYIKLAAGNGWITGYPDGSFRPDQSITRAETVTMINRVLERVPTKEEDLFAHSKMLTFPDCVSGDWYYIAIQEATNSHTYERAENEMNGDEEWIKLIENRDWTELEH